VVANGGDDDVVRRGNEEVLVGRLDDARFAYDRDRRLGLAAMVAELNRVSFIEGGGSLADKTARLGPLIEALCEGNDLDAGVRAMALRAAELCKADLVSRLVGEFSALQGYAGSVYAADAGEPADVCAAIDEHHRPEEAGGAPPASPAGAVVALADKGDTVRVAFAAGLEPTGSRDPYGLRRAAAGVVAIAISRKWRLDWRPVARKALDLYPAELPGLAPEAALAELQTFFADRLRNHLERAGSSYDEVSAVVPAGTWDFADAAERASALTDARRRLDFRSLVLAFKRIRNILGAEPAGEASPGLYREDSERALAADFLQAKGLLEELVPERRYSEALETIASISPSLDRFFVEVLVNAPEDDVRRNRHALLSAIQREFTKIADFSEIVVEK